MALQRSVPLSANCSTVEVETKWQISQIFFAKIFSVEKNSLWRFFRTKGTFLAVWGLFSPTKTKIHHAAKNFPMGDEKFLGRVENHRRIILIYRFVFDLGKIPLEYDA